MKVLEPENKVFTQPNRIQASAWNGWVQERGLYFLGEKDSRYKDLLQMEDQFPYNLGMKKGALVEADLRQRQVDLYGAQLLAAAAAGNRRRVPAVREPSEPGQGAHRRRSRYQGKVAAKLPN